MCLQSLSLSVKNLFGRAEQLRAVSTTAFPNLGNTFQLEFTKPYYADIAKKWAIFPTVWILPANFTADWTFAKHSFLSFKAYPHWDWMHILCAFNARQSRPYCKREKPNQIECSSSQLTSGGALEVDWNGMLVFSSLPVYMTPNPNW